MKYYIYVIYIYSSPLRAVARESSHMHGASDALAARINYGAPVLLRALFFGASTTSVSSGMGHLVVAPPGT